MTCDYCQGVSAEGATKCSNCGAPFAAGAPDYRYCPHCRRRLLALGSPACNYCGRALPANYVKARESIMRRVGEATEGTAGHEVLEELERESDGPLRRALDALFDLERKSKGR